MSIRTRIIMLVVLPVFLCVIFAQVSSGMVSKQTATKSMRQQSDSLNTAYGEVLSHSIENLCMQVESIARETAFFDAESSDQDKVRELQRHALNTDISNLGIFGADGKNLFIGYEDGSTVPKGAADVSGRPYLKEALAGNTVVFGPSKDVVTGRLTVTVVAPANVPGAPRSVVAVDFDLELLDAILRTATFGKTGHCLLIDSEGMLISALDDTLIGKNHTELGAQHAGLSQTVAQALQSSAGEIIYEDGDQYATYHTIPHTDGWRLITTSGTAEYLEDYYSAIRLQIIALVLYLVFIAFIAFFLGRRISNPIRFASRRVAALAQGDLTPVDYPKGAKRKEETGELIRSLSEAVSELTLYINDISEKLGAMAEGDLSLTVDQEYRGDFAPIKSSLTTIIQSFNDMFLEIDQTADQVADGSNQVANGAQALAQGSTEQASSTEHISNSMEVAMEQMNRAAGEATLALEKTSESNGALVSAREHMSRMLESMQAITEASESIGRIIKSIDDIAFQTNILALNAAVEAARAGQHGKGFAVVADEVRNLAAKSAEAARETSELIAGSIQAVASGMEIANETAAEIEKTGQGAEAVGELIQNVERVVNEQALAFAKISDAVEQISSVTQTNSATAEESAAASEELSSQAQMLKVLVSRIRLSKPDAPTLVAYESDYDTGMRLG